MIKFYRGKKTNYNTSTHQDGLYFTSDSNEIIVNDKAYGKNYEGSDSIEISEDRAISVAKVGTDKTKTTQAIKVAGGPLANNITDSGDVWPWKDASGAKIIPADKSIQEILAGLFLKPENGTAEWGQVSWDYSIAKPSVALSHSGDLEVGSKIKVTTLAAGATTPGTRRVTCDTNYGYFLSTESGAEHKPGDLVLEQSGNAITGTATLTTKWNNTAVSITTNSTELEVASGTNTLSVSQSGQTASVNLLPATTVYVSTNTNELAKNAEGNYIAVPFTDSEALCIKSKALSNSNSAQVTGKYYTFYKTFASGVAVTAPESSAKLNGYTKSFTAPTNFDLNIQESKSFSKIVIYTRRTIKEVKYVTPVMGQDWTTSNTTKTTAQVIKLPNGSDQSDYNKYVIATADDSNFPVGAGSYVSITYN